jgi:ABC-type xylose transport system substrate-binding protein
MPTYIVWYKGCVVVEAANEEEAIKKANERLNKGGKLLPAIFAEPIDITTRR